MSYYVGASLKRAMSHRPLAFLLVACSAGCAPDSPIERPAPLFTEAPIDYPLDLWDQDIEGQTLLRVRVTDTGSVDSAVVIESSGHRAFDSAAIAGARDLRFRPASKNGERVEVWARVPVRFSKRPPPDTAYSF